MSTPETITVREIPLTRGLVALVDTEDYDRVIAAGRWQGRERAGVAYASRTFEGPGWKRSVFLHSFLTGWPMVDHRNGNGLDNRRSNLRPTDQRHTTTTVGPTAARVAASRASLSTSAPACGARESAARSSGSTTPARTPVWCTTPPRESASATSPPSTSPSPEKGARSHDHANHDRDRRTRHRLRPRRGHGDAAGGGLMEASPRRRLRGVPDLHQASATGATGTEALRAIRRRQATDACVDVSKDVDVCAPADRRSSGAAGTGPRRRRRGPPGAGDACSTPPDRLRATGVTEPPGRTRRPSRAHASVAGPDEQARRGSAGRSSRGA